MPPRGDLTGEDFFELLRDFEGIDEVERTLRELAPFEPLHHTFSLERLLAGGIPVRFRMELHVVDRGDALRYLALMHEVVDERAHAHEVETLERRLRAMRELKHDVSNLLMGQMGFVDLLRDAEALPDDLRRKVERIQELGRQVSERLQRMGQVLHGGEDED